METLKNTLKNLLLNSSNPNQIISISYGMFKIWLDDIFNEATFEIEKELRIEGLEHLNEDGKIWLLKKAIATLS